MAFLLVGSKFSATDANGAPLAGGKVHTYLAGTTTPLATYTSQTGLVENANPVVLDSSGRASIWLGASSYKFVITDADDVAAPDGTVDGISAAIGIADLSSVSSTTQGDALVGVKRTLSGASATTEHVVNEHRTVIATADFGVPNDGTTNATTAIQTMINACAGTGVSGIYFPPGDYLLRTPANEVGEPGGRAAAAVIWKGLKNVRIHGSKGTRFIQDENGDGDPQFAMFRIEECTNVEFCFFEMDGSGIDTQTTGAARSGGFVICNYDLDTLADFDTPNTGIHIHHLTVTELGGFIKSATRNELTAYPLETVGVRVHDITATNINGQDHFCAFTYTRNVHIHHNTAVNDLTDDEQLGNLFVDCSAGVIDALVEFNYAAGFTGGCKAETHVGKGTGADEDRPSKNVVFRNNRLLEIGDPTYYVGEQGGWYGIKLNGINVAAYDNEIRARVTSVDGGGLYSGIYITFGSETPVDAWAEARGNSVHGTVIGISHDRSGTDTERKFAAYISDNDLYDMVAPDPQLETNDGTGIILGKNSRATGNKIYRAPYAAIIMQGSDETYARYNEAFDCCTLDTAATGARTVYQQVGSGTEGYWCYEHNNIVDGRGVDAAEIGYYFEAGTVGANRYGFIPGPCVGVLVSNTYEQYFSELGLSLQKVDTLLPGARIFVSTGIPSSTAPYGAYSWNQGDIALLPNASAGGFMGYYCTSGVSIGGSWVPCLPLQSANAWTVTNPSTSRTFDVSGTDVADTNATLGTLIADLKSSGILK